MLNCRSLAVLALALYLASGGSLALATPPNAGQILNQQRQPGARLPDRLPQDKDKETERAPLTDSGIKVFVKGFRFSGSQGLATDAGNYSLQSTTATTTADITPKEISATAITAVDKTYDSTTYAILNTANAGLFGVFAGDTTTIGTTSSAGSFIDPNVGQNKTVNVTDLFLSGLDAGNYTLAAYDTTASITAVSVPASLLSPQKSINGTQLNQSVGLGAPAIPAMGPGGGSIMLASFNPSPLVSGFSQTGGDMILSSTAFTAPVAFTEAGFTSTILLNGSTPLGTMLDVCTLTVCTQSGDTPVVHGQFVVQESPSSLSQTKTISSDTVQVIGTPAGQVIPFSLSIPNGMTQDLTLSLTDKGFLVITVPYSSGTIDLSQAVLMGMMIMKNEQNIDIGALKGVLLNQL